MARMKVLISKLFGFDREIDGLKHQVKTLMWDPAFGVYTRGGLMNVIHEGIDEPRMVAFLDFDGIHELNRELGYAEVDRRVRTVLRVFRKSDIIAGRWFSGDEIVVVFHRDTSSADAYSALVRLRAVASEHGLAFSFAVSPWNPANRALSEIIEILARQVSNLKAGKSERTQSFILLSLKPFVPWVWASAAACCVAAMTLFGASVLCPSSQERSRFEEAVSVVPHCVLPDEGKDAKSSAPGARENSASRVSCSPASRSRDERGAFPPDGVEKDGEAMDSTGGARSGFVDILDGVMQQTRR